MKLRLRLKLTVSFMEVTHIRHRDHGTTVTQQSFVTEKTINLLYSSEFLQAQQLCLLTSFFERINKKTEKLKDKCGVVCCISFSDLRSDGAQSNSNISSVEVTGLSL